MKTATKRRKKATRHTKLTFSGNGKGPAAKRTRNRAAKKHALIQAACGLFAAKGYEVTTTREIAASAGCAEGLIHRYFKGKPGLLAAMLEHRVSREILDLSHQPRPAPTLEDEFLQLVEREVERVWESRDFLRVVIPRAIVDPAVGKVMNTALIPVRGQEISERLKHYESNITLPRDAMQVLAQAVGMLGFVFGFVQPVLLGQDPLHARKMAAMIARFLVGSPVVSHLNPILP